MTLSNEKREAAKVAFIPLNLLRSGSDAPGGAIHVRKAAPTREEDAQTKASLLAEGVLQSVLACRLNPKDDVFYLAIGNRRLRLLNELCAEKKIPRDYAVPAMIMLDVTPAQARAMSLAENIERVPLHPVDRYEAFKGLAADGYSIEDVAKRFGITRKTVEQSMALGALSDKVLKAWRDGQISEDTARVFTVAPDHARQDQVLTKVARGSGKGQLNSWQIKNELVGNNGHNAVLLKLVGRDAYEKAGGVITANLFSNGGHDDPTIIASPDVLQRLVQQKIEAKCAELLKDGWKWAEVDEKHQRYSMDRISTGNKSKYTDTEKAGAGAFVVLDHDGRIKIELGYRKSRAKVAGEKAKATKIEAARVKPHNPNEISNSLERSLRAQFCKAVQAALTAHPHKDELATLLAGLTAKMITPSTSVYQGHIPDAIDKAMTKIADAVVPKVMGAALLSAFDAKDYFARVNAHICKAALAAMGVASKSSKKGDMAKLAVTTQKTSGWLPKELRTAHYVGPAKRK